jgi:hypothetical protein
MMTENTNPTDRSARDFFLFAVGFLAFGMAGVGVILVLPFLALSGLFILLLAVASFGLGRA